MTVPTFLGDMRDQETVRSGPRGAGERLARLRWDNNATTAHLTGIDFVGEPAPSITNEVVQGEEEGEEQAERP